MSNKNIALTFITVLAFFFGFYGMYKTTSIIAVFAILLGMYATLQSAIEAADFNAPRHKEVFIFAAKTFVTAITCLAAIFAQK
ncbi:hypothetical protein [Pantoea agglomerans]|uniref:hypothetical protein n=1 Tax=Enterobacter agglomerans TaxID=549 RepID=UPI003C79EC35